MPRSVHVLPYVRMHQLGCHNIRMLSFSIRHPSCLSRRSGALLQSMSENFHTHGHVVVFCTTKYITQHPADQAFC